MQKQDKETLLDIALGAGGAGVLFVQLSIITGLLPAVLLAVAAALVLLVPALVLGLAVAVVALPAYGLWRLGSRLHRRRDALKGGRKLVHHRGAVS